MFTRFDLVHNSIQGLSCGINTQHIDQQVKLSLLDF
jgi:hypothetical protein